VTVPWPNADFVAVAAGWNHTLGLWSDGAVVAWGWNYDGQCTVPSPNANFVAVAGGFAHSLGLKSDGTIVAWGWNDYGQCAVPSPNANFVWWGRAGITAWAQVRRHDCGVGNNNSGPVRCALAERGVVAVAGGSRTVWV